MAGKFETKEEIPSLDDWMAKIREKKLKPVVINEHKAREPVVGKTEKPVGPYAADEIVKLRQGLRSVSTPKWPGANDVKAKTNTVILPQRAQLRSVSQGPVATPDVPVTATDDTKSDLTKRDDPQPPAPDAPIAEGWIKLDQPDPAQAVSVSSTEALSREESKLSEDSEEDSAFPLDLEKKVNEVDITAQSSNEPDVSSQADDLDATVSSGAVESKTDVTLTLPKEEEDDFPLDFETEQAPLDAPEQIEEPSTPVTLSSGTFEMSSEKPELKLPEKDQDDFPLDLEQPGETGELAPDSTHDTTSEVAPSSGTTEESAKPAVLSLPPKQQLKTISTEEQVREIVDAQREAEKEMKVTEKASVLPSGGTVDPEQSQTVSEVLAEHVAPKPTEASSTRVPQPGSAANEVKPEADNLPTIKCSRCSRNIESVNLADHRCAP